MYISQAEHRSPLSGPDVALRRHVHHRLRLRLHRLERGAAHLPARGGIGRFRRRAARRRHRHWLRASQRARAGARMKQISIYVVIFM